MLTRIFQDLRLVIGVFFLILGVILLATALFGPSDLVDGIHLNLLSGLVMTAFGSGMIGLVALERPKTRS